MAQKQDDADWLRLQRKIFSRWVQQKVSKRKIVVNDIVEAMSDGLLLIALIEELTEKTVSDKYEKNPKNRAQKLDNASIALKFVFANGVELKVKPSPENIIDGDVRAILGLVWAMILKFVKIGDDDEGEQLNFKDALLLWVKNKVAGYNNVSIESFKKSFSDGMAFCALIHKHRPRMINYDSLHKEEPLKNLKIAMDAAEKYLRLEKYLDPSDIPKLDENGMVIYVSEYYYGIAEQRKLDIAARRIGKLIKFTQENDARKKEYAEKATELVKHIKQVEKILEDRTIDNTMAGARKRIDDFYSYKTKDKNVIINNQLTLEGLFNNLAMRLNNHKRPEFVPPSGTSLKDIENSIRHLEECEQERSVALHAELNRQILLVKFDEEHQTRTQKLKEWVSAKEAYLKTKEQISSVGAALFHLRTLDAFDKERESIIQNNIGALKSLGTRLRTEKYENIAKVEAREAEIDKSLDYLAQLSKEKRPVLDDDLAREQFKENVRLKNREHLEKFEKLQSWVGEKEAYLKKKESINSISEAQTHLGRWNSYNKENASVYENKVLSWNALGKEILDAKYQTKYSSYVWEKPDEINSRHSAVTAAFANLKTLAEEKKRVLDDDLAREHFKEELRHMDSSHQDMHAQLIQYFEEKSTYLKAKEAINSIDEAETALALLAAYEADNNVTKKTSVASHHAQGDEILAKKYETKYSSYVWEKPDDIKARQKTIDDKFVTLSQLSAAKLQVLQNDLKHEQEKERLRLEFAHHANEFTRFVHDTVENSKLTQFGFNLPEVEAFKSKLDGLNAAAIAEADKRKGDYEAVFKQGKDQGVTENIYTKDNLDTLAATYKTLQAGLEARNQAYAAHLKKHQEDDALCKQFAGLVEPLSKFVSDNKAAITHSKDTLEKQLAITNQRISSLTTDGASLAQIRTLSETIKTKQITYNRHTNLTLTDIEVQWDQWKAFLEKKKVMLEEEIEHQKLRGITQAEMNEIEENFKKFDYNKSGNIDKKELKACLYALGEEKSKSEIEGILTKYGTNGKIDFNGFRDFMITIYGDTDTKEEILNGFSLINNGGAVAKSDLSELVLSEADWKYITDTAPKKDGGYDYVAWTESVFAR